MARRELQQHQGECMTINAFHPDYVKTHMPNLMKKIASEEKAKENGKLYGTRAREREPSLEQPTSNTINKFPKTERVRHG